MRGLLLHYLLRLSGHVETAAEAQVKSIILFGYHGKLIKLAGNIFHTHHKLADARLEIMAGVAAYLGLSNSLCRQIFDAPTTERALRILKDFDIRNNTIWQEKIYQFIANRIEQNAEKYIQQNSDFSPKVGAILFDRQRRIICQGKYAHSLLWS